ncbi:MAG: diguanylate cyclase [Candidatus Manganitrophaceae bacterium]
MAEDSIKILLVEDNPDQRELTLYAFRKKDRRMRVIPVETGLACLEILGQQRFDAVILDYSLPKMNGIDVLNELQARGFTVPVIMVTGQGDEKIAVEAMKRGAYDYIIKSGNYNEILPQIVQKAVERHRLKLRVERTSQRMHRLYELSLALTTERRIAALLEKLVEGAKELIEVEGAILFILHPGTDEILMSATAGMEIETQPLERFASKLGLFGLAYEKRAPVMVEDPDRHPLKENTPLHRPLLRHLLSIPLIRNEKIAGILTVINKKEKEEPFSSDDIDALSMLCVNAAVAIDNARFLEETEKQAITDGLTGLYNHREFQKRLSEEIERAERYDKTLSLMMLDIDHFKVFNDTYGHPVGDAILKEIAKMIRQGIRAIDFPTRYGGEEFAVILPETAGANALKVAERIRQSIDSAPFVTPAGQPVRLSVSVGIAFFPEDGKKREALILAADQALYFAKKTGRNRVSHYADVLNWKEKSTF